MTYTSHVAKLSEEALDYIEAMACFMHTNYGSNGFLNGLPLEKVQVEALRLSDPQLDIQYQYGSNQIGTDLVAGHERISSKSGLDTDGRVRISFTTGKGREGLEARNFLADGHQDSIFFSAHSKPYATYSHFDRDTGKPVFIWKVDYKIGYIDGSKLDTAILNADYVDVKSSGDTYYSTGWSENLKIRLRKTGAGDMWIDYKKLGKVVHTFTVQEDPVTGVWTTDNSRINFQSGADMFKPDTHLKKRVELETFQF